MPRTKGTRNLKGSYYAVYRGDEFLAHGPAWELGWLFNLKENSVRLLAAPSYRKKIEENGNYNQCLIAIRVDELTEEDLMIEPKKEQEMDIRAVYLKYKSKSKTDKEIAESMGISRSTLNRAKKRPGFKETYLKIKSQCKTDKDIADLMNISLAALKKRKVKEHG